MIKVTELQDCYIQTTQTVDASRMCHLSMVHINFAYWVILHIFCRLLIFFKIDFFEKSFRTAIRASNILDPDLALHFVGPDLRLNSLQK